MNNIQKAFDGIRAEEKLKQSTLQFLRNAINEKNKSYKRSSFVRYRLLVACFAVVSFIGLFSYSWFTPVGYIGMDVNPSVELTVNRFDRVTDTRAFNKEGEDVLLGLSLRHRKYNEATEMIMDKITDLGYLREDGLVSITVHANDAGKENTMLVTIESGVNTHMDKRQARGQVEVFTVDSDTVKHAHGEGMSAAKYLAILELQELDPTATMDGHREDSVVEIRQIIDGHRGGHHEDKPAEDSSEIAGNSNSNDVPHEVDNKDSHGDGHGSSHSENKGHD